MALGVSEAELRELLVTRLTVIDTAEFDKGRAMAARLRIPLERALAKVFLGETTMDEVLRVAL